MSEIMNGEARQSVAVLRTEYHACRHEMGRRVDNLEVTMKQVCDAVNELKLRRARLDGVSALVIALITSVCSAGAAIAVALLR